LGVSQERIVSAVGQTEEQLSICCSSNAWGAAVVWKMPLNGLAKISLSKTFLSKTSLKQALQSPLTVGTWFTIVVTVLGVGYAAVTPRPSQSSPLHPGQAQVSALELAKSGNCQTLVTDPNPPLNVRSSPVAAKDNVVANLKNGTIVTVINENAGWFQIAQPTRGWIYQNLTVTTCNGDRNKTSFKPESPATEEISKPLVLTGDALVTDAQNKFHGGDLQGAIEQLRQVGNEDTSHTEATSLLKTMPEQWQSAVKIYHKAETAIQSHNPQVVLALVSEMPDIRHWRAKMTPLVKQAIAQQKGAF
jgi:Bacterial SH3 domain